MPTPAGHRPLTSLRSAPAAWLVSEQRRLVTVLLRDAATSSEREKVLRTNRLILVRRELRRRGLARTYHVPDC